MNTVTLKRSEILQIPTFRWFFQGYQEGVGIWFFLVNSGYIKVPEAAIFTRHSLKNFGAEYSKL